MLTRTYRQIAKQAAVGPKTRLQSGRAFAIKSGPVMRKHAGPSAVGDLLALTPHKHTITDAACRVKPSFTRPFGFY